MIGYQAFADLSLSTDSNERGHAAHLAALAYLDHAGPADEHAALYAALIGFLDDPSVKVRAALAYGLLHSAEVPRPIILALLRDSPVIARAVLQYSPVLVDADLMPLIRSGDAGCLLAIAQRPKISARIAAALVEAGDDNLVLRLLQRIDLPLPKNVLATLTLRYRSDARLRGALLARQDLPAEARMVLVRCVAASLRECRMVRGALAPDRLDRVLRDGTDTALSAIGEMAASGGDYARALVEHEQVSTRVLLHAVLTGHVMFFSSCLMALADVSQSKVFSLLETGSRTALMALFARAGLGDAVARVLARLILHARLADLSDDLAARHYVVTALTEEMIAEYSGDIPAELEEVFTYLNEQNINLARKAARGVVSAFAGSREGVIALPMAKTGAVWALTAA